MRESNFAFPAQNRACVCITSQLYDRRALDTTSPLPLLNSLTHLTYLTSTSPRIREILTCDGGLERLVRLLRDFCLSPPPTENPALIFGLSPIGLPRPQPVPALNPKSFDRHAAYRFSLAFQCVVNIGVRGSEPIRSRVVQAGTLEVVGCILEAWLASKGFAVGPNANPGGYSRESREQRQQRRQLQLEQRQRETMDQVARALTHAERLTIAEDEPAQNTSAANSDAETNASTDTSANATPVGAGTPTTGAVVVPGRYRSGTVVARRQWDQTNAIAGAGPSTIARQRTVRGPPPAADSDATSASTSRADTETEDDGEPDGDGDVEMEGASVSNENEQDVDTDENIPPPARRAVGIVADSPSPAATGTSDALDVDVDAHIIINTTEADNGLSDGIVALDQNVNDDLAMGAPPGAPGAIDATPRTRTNTLTLNTRNLSRDGHLNHGHHGREELTPRAVLASLPLLSHNHNPPPVSIPVSTDIAGPSRAAPNPPPRPPAPAGGQAGPSNTTNITGPITHIQPTVLPNRLPHRHHHHHHHRAEEPGPYREEDVLLSLQLLAYLSKYPHVRQAFYKPRLSFHPATAVPQTQQQAASNTTSDAWRKSGTNAAAAAGLLNLSSGPIHDLKKDLGFFKTLTGRSKEKLKEKEKEKEKAAFAAAQAAAGSSSNPPRMTNVFSLVERFTFRPSLNENAMSNPPFLPPEIQYWAGVIMRNACRKDESRGGIRQCANMLCGKWETFPREFAKCRRCRKAKYCGKECQSRAWSEGHRFWCSAREEETENSGNSQPRAEAGTTSNQAASDVETGDGSNGASRAERRQARERERQRVTAAAAAAVAALVPHGSPAAAATASRFPAATNVTNATASGLAEPRTAQEEASETMLRFAEAAVAVVSDLNSSQRQSNQPRTVSPSSASVSATPRAGAGTGTGTGLLPDELETMSRLTDRMDLSQFNAEQQSTIRNFLQAVGMASLEEHARGINILPQSRTQQTQSQSHSRSHSQPQNSNPSGSNSTIINDGPTRREQEDVNIEISDGHGHGIPTREVTLQDSLVAMEVPFAEEREGDEDMRMIIG